jgi:hypothetical protein
VNCEICGRNVKGAGFDKWHKRLNNSISVGAEHAVNAIRDGRCCGLASCCKRIERAEADRVKKSRATKREERILGQRPRTPGYSGTKNRAWALVHRFRQAKKVRCFDAMRLAVEEYIQEGERLDSEVLIRLWLGFSLDIDPTIWAPAEQEQARQLLARLNSFIESA